MPHDYSGLCASPQHWTSIFISKNRGTCLIYLPKLFCEVIKQLFQTAALACRSHVHTISEAQGSKRDRDQSGTTPVLLPASLGKH